MSYFKKCCFCVLPLLGFTTEGFAEGFIEGSHARLDLRNLYFNQDFRDGASKPSKTEEWGQGFLLDFSSGYTTGPVGLGIDALGQLGIKLDSGKGRHYNPSSANRGGQMFPTDSNGRAVDDFSSLGLTGKVRIAKTEIKLGALRPKLPVITYSDGRLLPETFQGVLATSKDLDNFTFTVGQIQRVKSRNSSSVEGMAIAGAGGAIGKRSNEFDFAGVDYSLSKAVTLQYYYAELKDFYRQHFIGLVHSTELSVGTLTSDFRYFDSSPSGKNGSAAGRSEGYKSFGYKNDGKVDNKAAMAMFTYSLSGHTLDVGYQHLMGSSDFPFVNQQDGSTNYLLASRQAGARFQKAGERTWVAQYSLNFAPYGIPGLTTLLAYHRGDHIQTVNGEEHEWERDFALSYAFQSSSLKGVGVSWRNTSLRSTQPSQRNLDENRIYITYTKNLF